jgi:pilus assembly protein CpaF
MMQAFSVQTYVQQFEPNHAHQSGPSQHDLRKQLDALVKQVRDLFLQQASTSWTEQMNRAVLGYPQERQLMRGKINTVLKELGYPDRPDPLGVHSSLSEAIFAEIIGMNILEKVMLRQAELDEIQVIGTHIFEVVQGVERRSVEQFEDVAQVERLQQNFVLFNQDRMNLGKRWAEVQLADGSRVTMTGFGFSSSPTITIRFYNPNIWQLDALVALGAMDDAIRDLLHDVLHARRNLVIIGATNSGKSMLMKALIAALPDAERLITIESRRELMICRDFPNRNVIEYEVHEKDEAHDGAQAFKLALRQSPRRIIVAEVRDADANHYVRACTRGHQGSMTTLHASDLADVPASLAEMCLQDGRALQSQALTLRIARYVVQVGIQMGTLDDSGRRGVLRIVEYEVKEGQIWMHERVRYEAISRQWVRSNVVQKVEVVT